MTKGHVLMYKVLLSYHFGYYDSAELALKDLVPCFKVLKLSPHFYTYHTIASMTYMALYRKDGKGKYLRMARSHKKKLSTLRGDDCPNSKPLLTVLAAEELSLVSTVNLPNYEIAVTSAAEVCSEAGLVQYTALVYERAGFTFAKNGNVAMAKEYFNRALVLYDEEWGSLAKCEWLTEQGTAYFESAIPFSGSSADVPKTILASNGSNSKRV
jgi:hypothetical protein